MKDSYYFSHDYNARSDEKIIKLLKDQGWEAYGLYWAIIEKLHESGGWLDLDYDSIAYDMRTDSERIAKVIREPLFKIIDKKFTTDRVLLNLKQRKSKSEIGKKSAQARWNKRDTNNANAMQTQCEPNAIKERKGKERKYISEYAYFGDPNFIKAFEDFIEMRKKSRKPPTDRAKELILITLHKEQLNIAISMLEQSVRKGWLDVFPLKQDHDKPKLMEGF